MLCIVQGDDRSTFKRFMELNRIKCSATMNCKYFRHGSLTNVQPHWRKVFWTHKVLQNEPCDCALWMDGDAVISQNVNIQNISNLFRGKDFVLSGENDVFHYNLSPFNAGVWMVHRRGLDILQAWEKVWTNNIRHRWNRTQDSWSCIENNNKTCPFARDAYEQGAFNNFVFPIYKNRIRVVPWHVLQNPHPQTVIHHFVGPYRIKKVFFENWMKFNENAEF